MYDCAGDQCPHTPQCPHAHQRHRCCRKGMHNSRCRTGISPFSSSNFSATLGAASSPCKNAVILMFSEAGTCTAQPGQPLLQLQDCSYHTLPGMPSCSPSHIRMPACILDHGCTCICGQCVQQLAAYRHVGGSVRPTCLASQRRLSGP